MEEQSFKHSKTQTVVVYTRLIGMKFLTSIASSLDKQPNLSKSFLFKIHPSNILDLERENLVTGLQTSSANMPPCKDCLVTKAPRLPQDLEASRVPESIGDIVSADIMGPLDPPCSGGGRYISAITDHFSGYTDIGIVTHNNVLQHVQEFFAFLGTQTGQRVKLFCSDNGNEYSNEDLRRFMAAQGTRHEFTAPYHPEGNGRSERQNRTIAEATRAL